MGAKLGVVSWLDSRMVEWSNGCRRIAVCWQTEDFTQLRVDLFYNAPRVYAGTLINQLVDRC